MPAHRFNGTEWELLYARFYSGAWSDTNDNFWAYDGGQWQLIQPLEAVGPGGLLPPENLTITDLGDHWVEITWTDPVQVTEDPTNVQYRIVEFGTVFTEVVYPTDIFNHEALDPETAYLFEVRYVRREAGEIVASSIVASIPFITLQLPVGEPGVDPGGGPGGSIIPIRPLPGGGPVGGPGCWFEWELFIISLDTLDWITTGITGTHPGDVEDFHYDLATLDPTRVYRFEFCENCDGVMGECNFGPSFNGIADWGADCGGIPASSSAANGIMADAIWAMPEICTIDGKQGLFDRISGTQLSIKKEAQGGGFAFWFTDADGEQAVKANLNGGNVWTVGLAAIETAIQAGQDFTIWYEWRNPDLLPDEGTFAKLAIGISHVFQLVQGPGGWKARIQFSKVGGGFITIESAEYDYDVAWHSMALRWDDDGPKDLFVDGSLAATDSSGVGMAPGSTILNSYVTGLSPGAETRKHYGWARLVSDFDMGQIHEPSITAWWGAAFAGRLLHSKRAAGQGIVKLAGAAGYGGIGGGACVVTVPLGHYYAIAGATGLSNPPNDVQLGAETWGFGGAGGSTDNGGPSQYHGGGRSDLRSGADRGTSVVIAPGGGASSNQFGGGAGGFPKGFPLTSTGGGFSGYNGVGGTETAGGAGGAGYAGGNTGSTGDNTAQGASGIGSGGRGGFGNYSFGQGGPGGGGGGGKHGGGGGAGANGSSDNGRGGGGGSGDTTGASSVIRTADGVNQGHGVVAMQVLAEYGDATKDFIDEHHPAVYVPCEEAAEEGCVVVTDVISGKGFWDREVAPLFAGAVGGRSDYSLQGNSLYLGRGAIYVWRTFQTHDFTMTEQDAVGVPWNPPVLNAGESWAIEWTQWSIAGATVYGPGTLDTGVDNFAAASSGVRPWFVWANATQVGISVATTAMGTIQSAVGNGFASRATNSVTRYGVSYNAATDTFHFYRADNEHHTMTRTTAGVPTTGKFNEKDWRPNLCSAHTNNDQSRIQDVAVFDYHRTQTMFQDGADALAVGAALSVTDATGGTIQRNGDYIEHTFTANGTFTPTTTKTCEVLIVGGGGGSGGGQTGVYYGAGGAGGEVNSFSGQVISAPVAITIGAGGTNQTVDATAGGVGGTTTAAGIGSAAGGEAGGADGMGHGGDNADYPGSTPPGGTAGGGGGGAGGPGSGSNGGPGLEWPAGSGRLWGSGGNGGPSGSRGAGESGAGSGSGSYSGRVVIRYPA